MFDFHLTQFKSLYILIVMSKKIRLTSTSDTLLFEQMRNEFSGNLPDFRPFYEATLTREEINVAIDTLNRFYEVAPFGHGEIEHTVNALDEYRHRMT